MDILLTLDYQHNEYGFPRRLASELFLDVNMSELFQTCFAGPEGNAMVKLGRLCCVLFRVWFMQFSHCIIDIVGFFLLQLSELIRILHGRTRLSPLVNRLLNW